jgi:hypothetical protein
MTRKTVIAMASAALMLVGFVVPVAAALPVLGTPALAGAGYKQDVGHWVKKCTFVRVRADYGWKKVKRCKKVWPKHYNSY